MCARRDSRNNLVQSHNFYKYRVKALPNEMPSEGHTAFRLKTVMKISVSLTAFIVCQYMFICSPCVQICVFT